MGAQDVRKLSDPQQLRLFMKKLLNDLRALEHMIQHGLIETGVRRIGAEQEIILTDHDWRPKPVGDDVLQRLGDPVWTNELARFNLEANLDPMPFAGKCLSDMEARMEGLFEQVRGAASTCGAEVVLCGILPTLRKGDLNIDNMTPRDRYYALDEALRRLRGGNVELRIQGTDELNLEHDSLMLESCNTSCQVHFQVAPDEFPLYYNIAQAVAGPVLAVASNSPLMLGKQLWHETRIAVFQQTVDTRRHGAELAERAPRVSFGDAWIKESVLEIYREDIARFRVILGAEIDEDPFRELEAGRIPELSALNLHNSTVYRWNRPCYGVNNGVAHLRIENRVLPSGPTVLDQVANAALWLGLITGCAKKYGDITPQMPFEQAKANFMAAARSGLDSRQIWFDGRKVPAPELVVTELVPLAREGLQDAGVDEGDIERYLNVVEQRASSGRNGAHWLIDSLAAMRKDGQNGNRSAQLAALVAATAARQRTGTPVHAWPLANSDEAGEWTRSFMRVEQFMTTDVVTVHEDEVIDLVANVMDWRRVRHVMVEDDRHNLVGVVSYRALLRYLAHDLPHGTDNPVPVKQIMIREPITIRPDTATLDAINIMRSRRIACLPVVENRRLVGVVTERDFLDIAAQLFEAHLKD